jgi:hypothetical protein
VAVVSISRIQVRRGQKNVGSGLPQLASGEFGWAVDTQELFIGNGSVSEGAPFVGNTKLLSENDNLFEFANTYEYQSGTGIQTGDSPNNPILRTLQERLDDRVSVKSFGANGDNTDQTVALQRAIDQLYLNASNKGQPQARVKLILEPGEYKITDTIYLPPFANIEGAGPDKTIINSSATVAFQTVNDTSEPGSYASDATSTTETQARKILLSNLTINSTSGSGLHLQSCRDSLFTDLILKGSYELGDTVSGSIVGIQLDSLSTAVSSNNNLFQNVVVRNYETAVESNNDIKDNAWTECEFDTLWNGFSLGLETILGTSGMLTGPINNRISGSKFNDIYHHAIHIKSGTDNISESNRFYSVGQAGGNASLSQYSIIKFESLKNTSVSDWFERSEELGYIETYKDGVTYHPEVEGATITEFGTTHKLTINNAGEFTKLFRLPADTVKGYEIDYIVKSNAVTAMRSGTMSLIVDPENNTFNFSDEYDFTGDTLYAENLKFTAQNYDEDGDTSIDTVAIMMQNLTANSFGLISGITLANPLQITTSNNPNIIAGQPIEIIGVGGTTQLNNNTYYAGNIVNVTGTTYRFDLYTDQALLSPVDGTTGFSAYTTGGTVSSSDNAVLHYKVKTKG